MLDEDEYVGHAGVGAWAHVSCPPHLVREESFFWGAENQRNVSETLAVSQRKKGAPWKKYSQRSPLQKTLRARRTT